ncbi:MAG: Gfo/Idh/MocA family oxidoreductase [Planctomycetes bacterium]|nr:Gfo/Idh/MocA family oxidoreductase [Planctomycetota bacterium]
MAESGKISRRNFLKKSASVGAGVSAVLHAKSVLGANDRIHMGVIGVGGMGGGHLRRLVNWSETGVEKIKVIGVCDIYEPRKERAQKVCGGKVFHEFEEMVQWKDLDAVVIATPDHWHAPISIAAMLAGKDVYCEKPMTRYWWEAKKVAEVQERTGRVFQCGAQRSSDDAWWQARKVIKEGGIGQPIWSQAGYYRNCVTGDWNYHIDTNASRKNLDWDRFLGSATKRPFDPERYFRFRKYWDYSGGLATDLLYHAMGPFQVAFGPEFPCRVMASGGNYVHFDREVPDTYHTLLDFPSGHTIYMSSTQANQTGIPVLIRGQEATIYFESPGIVVRPEKPFRDKHEERRIRRQPRANHMANFIECVRTRKTPNLDAKKAYAAMVGIALGVKSYREKKVMLFDPEKEKLIS